MARQLFVDVDGVVADFDSPAEEILGCHPRLAEEEIGIDEFWRLIRGTPDFYRNLPLMQDAHELVNAVRHLNPIFLTGVPQGDWAREQKLAWRDEHFPGIPMICTASKDKRTHAKAGDVLVDDWLKYRDLWIENDGIFIHHKSAKESIKELSQYFRIMVYEEKH